MMAWVWMAGFSPALVRPHAPHYALAQPAGAPSRIFLSADSFKVGDKVRVRKEVTHGALDGRSSLGMVGTVVDTWSICEEDPVCCCAELAADWTTRVAFSEPAVWTGYFADDEIERCRS